MRNGRQLALQLAAATLGSILLAHSGLAGEPSAKDDDAFVLYKYALLDAQGDRSPRITTMTEGDRIAYRYDGHALSCRTVMTGSMSSTSLDGRTHIVGEFEVSNNSYGIEKLSFDFYEGGSKTRAGTMTVDGKVIEIGQLDHR